MIVVINIWTARHENLTTGLDAKRGPRAIAHKSLLHGRTMRAGHGPQAPVLQRRVLKRGPQSYARRRVRVQKCRVLVRFDRPTNAALLENEHALQQKRVREPERLDARLEARRVDKRAEYGVLLVQRMPNLVDRLLFGLAQLSFRRPCVLLKEEANLVTRR